MKKVKKRKKKNNSKKIIVLSTFLCFIGIITLSYIFSSYFVKIYQIYKEKKELTKKIATLSEEKDKLSSEVEKLKDPEYVARYAREKYFYSKDGEYIIKIPK